MTFVKGDAIRFIAGKYAGLKGWKNKAENSDDEITPVIVDRKRHGLKATFVYNSSFVEDVETVPVDYAHAVIQQCPNIEKNLVTVTRQMAKCDINEKNIDGFNRVMNEYLCNAVDWQTQKGTNAMYRHIEWPYNPKAKKDNKKAKKDNNNDDGMDADDH